MRARVNSEVRTSDDCLGAVPARERGGPQVETSTHVNPWTKSVGRARERRTTFFGSMSQDCARERQLPHRLVVPTLVSVNPAGSRSLPMSDMTETAT